MSTQAVTSTNRPQELSTNSAKGQFKLWQILLIWLAAGAPMWLLSWIAYPALSAGLSPLDAGMARYQLLTMGLVWQFALALAIVYAEEGNIRLTTVRRRFWLNHPISARTGETNKSLWWWIIPLILLVAALEVGLRSMLVSQWTAIFPFFAQPKGYDVSALFSPGLRAQWHGAWSFFWLFFVNALFNTVLGEELIFHGVLLPTMRGVFGKWDWVANGVLFGLYHLHQPWGILSSTVSGLIYAFSGKQFHSNWFPIILHSGQSVYLMFLILGLVLGLA